MKAWLARHSLASFSERNMHMTTAVIDETVRGRALDALGRAAHIAHEARLVKSLAADAIEEAVHASKQTIKTARRRVQDLADRRHELAHQVRREPLKAIGIAFGAGLLLGTVTASLCRATRSGAK